MQDDMLPINLAARTGNKEAIKILCDSNINAPTKIVQVAASSEVPDCFTIALFVVLQNTLPQRLAIVSKFIKKVGRLKKEVPVVK